MGEANGYAPKAVGLLLMPAIIAVIGHACSARSPTSTRAVSTRSDRRPARLWIMGASMVVLGGVHVAADLAAVGASIDIGRVVGIGGRRRCSWSSATTSARRAATGSSGSGRRGPSRASGRGPGRTAWAGTSSWPRVRQRRSLPSWRPEPVLAFAMIASAAARRDHARGLLVLRLALRPGPPPLRRLTCPSDRSSRSSLRCIVLQLASWGWASTTSPGPSGG